MNLLQLSLFVTIALSFNGQMVTADALSSQDGHMNLIDYRPLLQFTRKGRQNIAFDRHPAIPQSFNFGKDDYGRTNEITSPTFSTLPQGHRSSFDTRNHPPGAISPTHQETFDHRLEVSAASPNQYLADTCPIVETLPAYECAKRRTRKPCWSVGQRDVDCPTNFGSGYGLCCFDGCSNSCQYETETYEISRPLPVPPISSRPPGIPSPPPLRARPTSASLLPKKEHQTGTPEGPQHSHHAQEYASGAYHYGYSDGLSQKEESRKPDGSVHGSYSYRAPDGRVITNNYVADAEGFRSSLSTSEGEYGTPENGHNAEQSQYSKSSHFSTSNKLRHLEEELRASEAVLASNVNHDNSYYEPAARNHIRQKPTHVQHKHAIDRNTPSYHIPSISKADNVLAQPVDGGFQSFLNGDYVLDLNSVASKQQGAQRPPLPTRNSIPPILNDHHSAPTSVFPTHPTHSQEQLLNEPSPSAPGYNLGHAVAASPQETHDLYLDSAEQVQTGNIDYDQYAPIEHQPTRFESFPATNPYFQRTSLSTIQRIDPNQVPVIKKNEYVAVPAVPVPDYGTSYQDVLSNNDIVSSSHGAPESNYIESFLETINLPGVGTQHGTFGNKVYPLEDNQETKEDHYLEKIHKIANGELGDEYRVLKEKHNPHKARKSHKTPAPRKESFHHHTESRTGYLPASTQSKANTFNINASENKYRNPALEYNLHANKLPPVEDPYYEVPDVKLAHLPVSTAPSQDASYLDSSEAKYRNPASQYDDYGGKEPKQPYDSSYYSESSISKHGQGRTQQISDSYYNNLKSEDRYFNVPVVNDGHGPEISLIGVDLEDQAIQHNSDYIEDKHEVYTITDQKSTNVDSGRLHHGKGFATRDGFYYTKTEDYNPTDLTHIETIVEPSASKRLGHYTEEIIKPIVVPDDPFSELNKLVSSAHPNNNEGPAFEYPEVISDPRGEYSRSPSETQYKETVQHHITDLRDSYNGNSRVVKTSTGNGYGNQIHKKENNYKSKHTTPHYREHAKGKVYSFGKSMSTIPFTYVETDDYAHQEPSVLEQLARNHIEDGHPIRLSDTGAVSDKQRPSSPPPLLEPDYHPNPVVEERENFPFIAAIRNPGKSDINDHTNNYSLKAKKSNAIGRRRKVIKQRRRGGYGGRRRTARKANNEEEELPFTPKERQEYIKEMIDVKRRHEEVERRKRLALRSVNANEENFVRHSPTSYSYSSFRLGSSS